MKKTRFSEQQLVKILREADATPVVEVARKHGISDQTIYLWRKRFGKLEAVDVKRLRHLEQENAKLKKLVAERDLEIEVMKEVAAKNGKRARATAADRVCLSTRSVDPASVRAAECGAIQLALSVAADRTRRSGADGDARARDAVSALRLPAHPGVPGAAWPRDERRSGPSAVASAWAASAEKAAAPPRGQQSAAAVAGDCCQPDVSL